MAILRDYVLILLIGVALHAQAYPELSKNEPRCAPIKMFVRDWDEYAERYGYLVSESDVDSVQGEDVRFSPKIYDENEERCISQLQFVCLVDLDCGTGAICDRSFYKSQFYGSPGNARRVDPSKHPLVGLCQCQKNKIADRNSTHCLGGAKYGEYCDSVNKPCSGMNVDCSNNKCTCTPRRAVTRVDTRYYNNVTYYYAVLPEKPYEGNPRDILEFPMIFDQEENRCVITGNGPCHTRTKDCPKTKSCSSSSSGNFGTWEGDDSRREDSRHPLLGRCDCYGGMTRQYLDPTTDTCVVHPNFGETCSEDIACNPPSLQCRNSRCTCPNEGGNFVMRLQRCVAQIGSKCDGYSSNCVENAKCRNGVCECNEGFVNSNGTCYGAYMASCSESSKSDPTKFFKCIDGFCKCGDPLNQVYNEDHSICQALVGSKCAPSTGINLPTCGQNAGCVDGNCKCNSGTSATSERKCETFRGLGAHCGPGGCNHKAGWACIDSKCQCIDDILTIKNGKCMSQIGSHCGNVEVVGRKLQNRRDDAASQKFYYVGCDEDGICDASQEGRSICKKKCYG